MASISFVSAKKVDLIVYGGDTISFPATFTDENGDSIDLSSNTYLMEIKDTSTTPFTLKISFSTSDSTITIGGTDNNVLTFYKQDTTVGNLYAYDLFQTDNSGLIKALMYGKFTIIQRITNSQLDS